MAEPKVSLSLSAAERAHLAGLGVTADERGVLRSSGREVDPGIAAAMLAKARDPRTGRFSGGEGIRSGSFQRPYLAEGHQAQAAHGVGGVPFMERGAQPRPDAGDGLTAADAVKDDDPGEDDVAGGDIDGSGSSHQAAERARAEGLRAEEAADSEPSRDSSELVKALTDHGVMARALSPEDFRRGYLAAGHQAGSPAVTGHRAAVPVPAPHPAQARDFRRGWLAGGHQSPSPDDRPGNNPHPAGSTGAQVYGDAAAGYAQGRAADTAGHVAQTGGCESQPAPEER